MQSILGFLSAGDSESDILGEFPELEAADIRACLLFASQVMNQRHSGSAKGKLAVVAEDDAHHQDFRGQMP